jgi:hypothetical protein
MLVIGIPLPIIHRTWENRELTALTNSRGFDEFQETESFDLGIDIHPATVRSRTNMG